MATKISVVVLGSTGMIGSMVFSYLKKNEKLEVTGIKHKPSPQEGFKFFDVPDFLANEDKYRYLRDADYVINCVGIIKPYCKDNDPEGVFKAIQINAYFPHRLSNFLDKSKTKVIQIATDCVYSGSIGNYTESAPHDALDVYGKTKSLGEVRAKNLLNIRCSAIGPEIKGKLGLLEWFLSQPKGAELKGFTNHLWNGVTTLQFAELCEKIIVTDSFAALHRESFVHHYTPNDTVNKFRLLEIFNKAFNRDCIIEKENVAIPVNRAIKSQYATLAGLYCKTSIEDAVKKLAKYMACNNLN